MITAMASQFTSQGNRESPKRTGIHMLYRCKEVHKKLSITTIRNSKKLPWAHLRSKERTLLAGVEEKKL